MYAATEDARPGLDCAEISLPSSLLHVQLMLIDTLV